MHVAATLVCAVHLKKPKFLLSFVENQSEIEVSRCAPRLEFKMVVLFFDIERSFLFPIEPRWQTTALFNADVAN